MRHSGPVVRRAGFLLLLLFFAPFLSVLPNASLAQQYPGRWATQLSSFCGNAGKACCKPPPNDHVGAPFCNAGLCCDIAANRCVAACGGDGQACCDGPDTLAPRSGASPSSASLYCPDGTASCVPRKPMCVTGACEVGSHRCKTCGQGTGVSCCPPDAQSAVGTCKAPGTYCSFNSDSLVDGVCASCGRAGEPPCPARGGSCDAGLTPGTAVCEPCGKLGQQLCLEGCSEGAPSIPLLEGQQRLCVACGGLGQPPCRGNVCADGQPFHGLCANSAACASYALTAAKANARNVSSACGLMGTRWISDTQYHVRLCRDVSPEWLEQENAARESYLARCPDCKPYAELEVRCSAPTISTPVSVRYMKAFDSCVGRYPPSVASEMSSRGSAANPCSPPARSSPSTPGTPPSRVGCCIVCVPNSLFPPLPVGGGGFPPGGSSCTPMYQCGPQCPPVP